MRTRWILCALLVVGACATAKTADPGGDDKTKPRESHEIVSGAGVVKGGNVRAVVTIGGPLTPAGAHRQGTVQQ